MKKMNKNKMSDKKTEAKTFFNKIKRKERKRERERERKKKPIVHILIKGIIRSTVVRTK